MRLIKGLSSGLPETNALLASIEAFVRKSTPPSCSVCPWHMVQRRSNTGMASCCDGAPKTAALNRK